MSGQSVRGNRLWWGLGILLILGAAALVWMMRGGESNDRDTVSNETVAALFQTSTAIVAQQTETLIALTQQADATQTAAVLTQTQQQRDKDATLIAGYTQTAAAGAPLTQTRIVQRTETQAAVSLDHTATVSARLTTAANAPTVTVTPTVPNIVTLTNTPEPGIAVIEETGTVVLSLEPEMPDALTRTILPTGSPTATITPTFTLSPTRTPTNTATYTPTATPTDTPTPTPTNTPTPTDTPTPTNTPTPTPTNLPIPTATAAQVKTDSGGGSEDTSLLAVVGIVIVGAAVLIVLAPIAAWLWRRIRRSPDA